MATRYETFNEIAFESYCKKAVGNAIKKERSRKNARGKLELPLSVLTDAALYALSPENEEINRAETNCRIFQVQEVKIPVYGEALGQALSCLLPKDREIILLYFFRQVKTDEIARRLKVSPSTVRRRRTAALRKLRDYLEAVPCGGCHSL